MKLVFLVQISSSVNQQLLAMISYSHTTLIFKHQVVKSVLFSLKKSLGKVS